MLHTVITLLAAAPPEVPVVAPPGGANILKIGGWIMFIFGILCVVAIAKSGVMIGLMGGGHGGGERVGLGFVAACLGAIVCFGAWGISLALV